MKKVLDLFNNYIDEDYKLFSSSLLPNIDFNNILGVRIPYIRKIAKQLTINEKRQFMLNLPHKYLEENILHSILINELDDFEQCIDYLELFLPFVDNWSVCDTLTCNILCNDMNKFFDYLVLCIESNITYKVRFAFVMMLKHFINNEYIDRCNSLALNFKSDEYYINMSIAWYFSYALIFEYDKTVHIFENKQLSKFVHNKSISKACDSYRLSTDLKCYLKGLRIK